MDLGFFGLQSFFAFASRSFVVYENEVTPFISDNHCFDIFLMSRTSSSSDQSFSMATGFIIVCKWNSIILSPHSGKLLGNLLTK